MIRAIAAVDDRLGLATASGIPWSVPADVEHFRSAIASTDVLMGFTTYTEYAAPMAGRTNYVATRGDGALREGFVAVADAVAFLSDHGPGDLWVIGGAGLFAATLPQVEELFLTRIDGDFHCTVFFPSFEADFELVDDQPSPSIDGIPAYRFQIWRPKVPLGH